VTLVRALIRIWAFVGKEIAEVLRQPLLVLTLIVAPFLILLLFGLGFRGDTEPFRAQVVMAEDSPLRSRMPELMKPLEPIMRLHGVTPDEGQARALLRDGEVDLVIIAPEDPLASVQANRRAPVTFLHNEIDPFRLDSVNYAAQAFVTAANQLAARGAVGRAQERTAQTNQDVAAARAAIARLKIAQATQDQQETTGARTDLRDSLLALAGTVGGLAVLGGSGSSPEDLEQSADRVGGGESDPTELDRLDGDLARMQADLTRLNQAEPAIVTQPFSTRVRGVAEVQPSTPDYFAPGVVVLLLQHLGVTLAGLSLVRERRMGSMELFRVSPLTPFQTLAGKYTSFLLFEGVIALLLTLLLVYGLDVPFLGDVPAYAGILAALLVASLGLGFLVSLVARTETEAVQYAMMILLTSVFFSGFILSLQTLSMPVRIVSWLLPATYAIQLLQHVMLRGSFAQPELLVALVGMGLALFLVAWLLLRRQFRRL
jgi:ABC-2 type transport system permease protein